jgi:ABC-type antimicrobial peptide transport system permease subunit
VVEDKATQMVKALSLGTNMTVSAPLEAQFDVTHTIEGNLQASFFSVMLFLIIVSSMLLFSLVMSDSDAKTFEYGMLRSLGFKKSYLVSLITTHSMMFSIPGMVIGILVAFIINVGVR